MNRPFLAAACLLFSLALGGCQLLNGTISGTEQDTRRLLPGATPQTQSVMYLGDTVGFTIDQKPTMPTTTQIELLHLGSEASRSFQLPFSDLETFTMALKEDKLPGYQEDALNRYRLTILMEPEAEPPVMNSREFFVVSDRSIQAIPPRRDNSNARVPTYAKAAGTVEALEALAMEIATRDWKGQGVTMTRRQLSQEEAAFSLSERDDLEAWEFVAMGEYPRYAVPSEFNLLAGDAVMKPTWLRISLSRTEPIYVLSILAVEEPLEPAQP
ncbi:hypothetical protein D3C87_696620 [compost metagenome]